MTTQATSTAAALPLLDAEPVPVQRRVIPAALRSQDVQFWLLQGVGWSGWAGSWMASGIYWGMESAYNLAVLVGMATGMLLTAGLRELYQLIWQRPLWAQAMVLLLAAYGAAMLWQVAKNVALFEFYGPFLDLDRVLAAGWVSYLRGTLSSFYIMLCWSGLYFGIKYYRMLLVERDRALTAMATAREAQLRMLRYQLNPHFLFNTLNAISTLVLEQDTGRAERMVNRLSSFLRYSLDTDPMQKVAVSQEVAALQLYLEIEQVRFEDRLRLVFDVSEDASQGLLPGLLLQPLVENAIKHSVACSADGGSIAVRGRLDGDWLELRVSDDGPGVPDAFSLGGPGGGVGLANIRDRLAQVYGPRHEMRLEPAAEGGLSVVIRIPFEVARGDGP